MSAAELALAGGLALLSVQLPDAPYEETPPELDPARLKWAREVAENAGVSSLIRFVQGDLFEVPLQDATVVTLYLLRPTNLRLRPRLLRELRPGTRVVSLRFDMGNWEAERTEQVGNPPRTIYRWTIPEPRPIP